MGVFFTSTVVMASLVYAYIYQTVQFKYIQFIVCQLYHNKTAFKKKITTKMEKKKVQMEYMGVI